MLDINGLPERLGQKLAGATLLHAAIIQAFTDFAPWLGRNDMPFFPEYTDHGPDHILRVITTADSLIHDSAWDLFSANDAGVLVLAILLHDIAMHLTPESFLNLISPSNTRTVNFSNDRPWSEVWNDFFAEARRWDAKKLNAILGDAGGCLRSQKISQST
jgi:hypothetical protein